MILFLELVPAKNSQSMLLLLPQLWGRLSTSWRRSGLCWKQHLAEVSGLPLWAVVADPLVVVASHEVGVANSRTVEVEHHSVATVEGLVVMEQEEEVEEEAVEAHHYQLGDS